MKRILFTIACLALAAGSASAQFPGMAPGYGPQGYGPPQGPGMAPGYGPQGPGGVMPAGFNGVGPVAHPYAAHVGGGSCATGNCGSGGEGSADGSSRFGYHPLIKRLFKIQNDPGSCNNGKCGAGGPGGYPGGGVAGPGGTLVFPNNPYIRSPRDFFEK